MFIEKLSTIFKKHLYIDNRYLALIIYTLIAAFIIKIISVILKYINKKITLNEKQIYIINKRNKTILTIVFTLTLFIIWKDLFKNIITLISFVSAAITLAAKDIIFNYFCGIYIKITKPIKIEDRVKIGDHTGDIININTLNFELLEVNPITNQSTGIIIHIPNSHIFNTPLKNYNKAFKYIWDEITIKIDIKNDINLAKKILYKIIITNKIIKEIPKKMKKEIEKTISEYRIYYNNYAPIIYTKIEENQCILTIRFLIHPKKARNVESDIYEEIIYQFKENNIIFK